MDPYSLITKRLYFVQTLGDQITEVKYGMKNCIHLSGLMMFEQLERTKQEFFIRDCFREWQKKYNKYNVDVWKINILCKRVCSLLENSSFFFLNS